PGMPEDHPANPVTREALAHSAHVVGEALRRHRRIFDELHRAKRRIEARENRTCGMTKIPELRLRRSVQGDSDGGRPGTLEHRSYRSRRLGRCRRHCSFDLGEEYGLRLDGNVADAASSGNVQESSIQKLASDGAPTARPYGRVHRWLEIWERAEHAARGTG